MLPPCPLALAEEDKVDPRDGNTCSLVNQVVILSKSDIRLHTRLLFLYIRESFSGMWSQLTQASSWKVFHTVWGWS